MNSLQWDSQKAVFNSRKSLSLSFALLFLLRPEKILTHFASLRVKIILGKNRSIGINSFAL